MGAGCCRFVASLLADRIKVPTTVKKADPGTCLYQYDSISLIQTKSFPQDIQQSACGNEGRLAGDQLDALRIETRA